MPALRSSLEAVLDLYDQDSPDYRIANYLLNKYYRQKEIGIQEISEQCYVSKSTVSRFCRRIGYENYWELNQELYEGSINKKFKYEKYLADGEVDYELYYKDLAGCLLKTRKSIHRLTVERWAGYIAEYEKIGVFGKAQSHAVAMNFQHDLLLCRKVVTASCLPADQRSFLLHADKNTLVVIVSCSGNYFRGFISDENLPSPPDRPRLLLLTNNEKMKRNNYYDEVAVIPCEDNYPSQPQALKIFLDLVALTYARQCDHK